MPVLIDDTHDRGQIEAARDLREQREITADKVPGTDGNNAQSVADKYAANVAMNALHRAVQQWVREVWNLDLYAMRCFDTAREIEQRISTMHPQPIDEELRIQADHWIAFGSEVRAQKATFKSKAEECRAALVAAGGKYRLPWEE